MGNSDRRRGAVRHFIVRVKERYALDLSGGDVLTINQTIWRGDGIEFSRQKRKGKRFFVSVNGTQLPVIYHVGYHSVVTVLPADAAEVERARAKIDRH